MILPIIYYGNPLLRQHSKKIIEINGEVKQLAFDMIETMDALRGVGLAAVQVGKPLRIFVMRPGIEQPDGKMVLGEVEVYINPKILSVSKEEEINEEGCLSVPGFLEEVKRPFSVVIEATDLEGRIFRKELKGFPAREALHENDHLNAVLFIDRLSDEKKKEIKPLLNAIEKKSSGLFLN